MSPEQTKTRKMALKLLGIPNESDIAVFSAIVADQRASAADLAELPSNALILAQKFEEKNHLEVLQQVLNLPISPDVAETAKRILRDEIGLVAGRSNLKEAIRISVERMNVSGSKCDSESPIADVEFVSAVPFLFGPAPPYLPVLNVSIKTKTDREIMSATLGWLDILFICKALLQHVSEHAENSSKMIRDELVSSFGDNASGRAISEIQAIIDGLGQRLSPSTITQGTVKGTVNPPNGITGVVVCSPDGSDT